MHSLYLFSNLSNHQLGDDVTWPTTNLCGLTMATSGIVSRSSIFDGGQACTDTHNVEPSGIAAIEEYPSRPGHNQASHLEVIQ